MTLQATPYGKAEIGLVRPGPGQVDAQVIDVHREGQLAGRRAETYQGVPPVKKAPWEWYYIAVYFWVGGIAAGAWLAATAESVAGDDDRRVVGAGRYLALAGTLAGTGLLVADLGRPERFLNMLRVVRARSPMSLGSFGLATFGGFSGAAAALQAAEDGVLGRWPRLARLSRGLAGRALHLVGLPLGLFVGSYTGALAGSTSTPSWARRHLLLPPLFVAAGASNGLAAVSALVESSGGDAGGASRRLARAEAVALAAELALLAADRRAAGSLPSARREPLAMRAGRWLAVGAGIATPLAVALSKSGLLGRRGRLGGHATSLAASALALAGGLALRVLVLQEGKRSADTPEDTWAFAGDDA